jgi:hypothetical protein
LESTPENGGGRKISRRLAFFAVKTKALCSTMQPVNGVHFELKNENKDLSADADFRTERLRGSCAVV